MPAIHEYNVVPVVPERLAPLKELAYNLHWTWNHEIFGAFRWIDQELWRESRHNPVFMLGGVSQKRLDELAQDDAYLTVLERVSDIHKKYMSEHTWYATTHGATNEMVVAYFAAEFGLTECLPIYSGGLGVLSGDHLKSSSELGIPLVGVGLLYQHGYFRQYLSADGWQQELHPENDFYNMPLTLERNSDGSPLTIEVPHPGKPVVAQIWRCQVGRNRLVLLDTDLLVNSPRDREIVSKLYGGDREMRIRQELVLGIGGTRALRALGIVPTVCHMNEGHSAFQALERIRQSMQETGLGFRETHEMCTAGNVFTTHTPVPAGFDLFSRDLMRKYFENYVKELRIDMEELLRLGRAKPDDREEPFNMAMLAIRSSGFTNAVSKLHGAVSRKILQPSLPAVPIHEIAVDSVSNGAHTRSWISEEMVQLFDRYLGERWHKNQSDPALWRRVDNIPNEEIWRTHERRRERLVAMARRRLRDQLLKREASQADIEKAEEALDPTALTIGLARRFATYKRSTLLFRDLPRLKQILLHPERPVQILVAGKAHPDDHAGKELIRQIVHAGRQEELRRRIVFLEDYDLAVARYMVQGVDVWLNTPRRPNEASGTSGMKVVFNGGLNVSILDGWWCEGYRTNVGWAIGRGEEYQDHEYQDRIESEALYDLLEEEVIPTFYNRGKDRLPRDWIGMMKSSMRELAPEFCSNRMVREYTERFYLIANRRFAMMKADKAARAVALSQYKANVQSHWHEVKIIKSTVQQSANVKVGDDLAVTATVHLGNLAPEQVSVQIYDGTLDEELNISEGNSLSMTWRQNLEHGTHLYEGSIPCTNSGRRGFTIRVMPVHQDLLHPQMMGLICWEYGEH